MANGLRSKATLHKSSQDKHDVNFKMQQMEDQI